MWISEGILWITLLHIIDHNIIIYYIHIINIIYYMGILWVPYPFPYVAKGLPVWLALKGHLGP